MIRVESREDEDELNGGSEGAEDERGRIERAKRKAGEE